MFIFQWVYWTQTVIYANALSVPMLGYLLFCLLWYLPIIYDPLYVHRFSHLANQLSTPYCSLISSTNAHWSQ